ncbi:MAG: transposase [Myxococcaceae bacterium]
MRASARAMRLCRYGARGPLALERLSRREDGKLEYRLKKPSRGGATTLVLTPVQLLKRLCALVVKPRVHLTKYFGVFAPAAKARAEVVAQRPVPPLAAQSVELEKPTEQAAARQQPASEARPPYLNFADLLRRTLGIDLFTCPCGGRRSIVASHHLGGGGPQDARPSPAGHQHRAAAPRHRAAAAGPRAHLTASRVDSHRA